MKLKIHFLEEKLEKANPNLNQTALKENIDLKISGKTMERELHRCKKNLIRAERKAEACQRELEEFHERWKEKQVDGTLQKELGWMKDEIESKDLEIKQLHDELTSAKEKESSELQDLREQITDLEYNLREKERILDQKDEEIEDLKDKEQEEHSSVAELEAQLERAKNQINDLKDSIECLKSDSQQTEAANQQAIEERNRAVEDLRELQDEMANKSFYTKGLNRQLEEKASALEDEVSTLRQQMDSLQEELESQKRSERQLERQFDDLRREHASEKTRFQDEIDSIRHERDLAKRELDSVSSLLHEAEDELGAKGDAKSLLQMRHDALTNESQCLQKDLERARTTIHELEQQVADEKQRSFESMEELKSHYKDEIDHLHDDIESLQRRIEDSESRFDVDRDKWESARRTLELQRHQAEQQGSGYKRTIERLQQTENSLSGKEKKFQDILDSEKLQRTEEKELLNRQINELNEDVAFRRQTIENQRAELFSLKEDLRAATREAEAMRERIQNLEDDKVVLQAELEQEQQLGQNQRKNGVSELEKLLQSSTRDRQFLRGRLADMEVELKELRATIPDIEADRDELKSQLNRIHSQVDETYRLDQEKLDLRKAKLRLEGELKRLKEEKEALLESKNALRIELDAEIKKSAAEENRLSSEIDRLQDRLLITSEKRDRELASAKGKAERFEKRARDLESVIEQQKPDELDAVPVTSDSSILRQHLDEARKKERSALQRESDLRSSVRQLKTRINELEAENHDLQTQKIDSMAVDGGLSPSSRFQEELRKLRSQVLEAHKKMKELRAKNNELQRYAMMAEERKDLHELLKSSTLEAESLSVKLAERDARVIELRNHLRRVREERSLSKKDAETANRQLQILQDKYDIALDDMAMRAEKKGRHEKELKGLSKEIMWLRARLSREQKFRKDLAWSKGIMELGERVRVAWYVLLSSSFRSGRLAFGANISCTVTRWTSG